MSCMWLQVGSLNGTHSTLSSSPFSSVISKTPIGSTGITHPGNVGDATRITASTGSPSRPSVSIRYP